MSSQEIESDKLQLIQWIAEIQDSRLLKKLMKLRTQSHNTPDWQMEEVNNICEGIDNGTISTRTWEEAKNDIFKKA